MYVAIFKRFIAVLYPDTRHYMKEALLYEAGVCYLQEPLKFERLVTHHLKHVQGSPNRPVLRHTHPSRSRDFKQLVVGSMPTRQLITFKTFKGSIEKISRHHRGPKSWHFPRRNSCQFWWACTRKTGLIFLYLVISWPVCGRQGRTIGRSLIGQKT